MVAGWDFRAIFAFVHGGGQDCYPPKNKPEEGTINHVQRILGTLQLLGLLAATSSSVNAAQQAPLELPELTDPRAKRVAMLKADPG